MPDETFLPETELRAYSYRGAYGQPVAGPWSNSMNPGVGGMAGVSGMGALPGMAALPTGALGLASLGLAVLGGVKAADAGATGKPTGTWLAVLAAGLFGLYCASRDGSS